MICPLFSSVWKRIGGDPRISEMPEKDSSRKWRRLILTYDFFASFMAVTREERRRSIDENGLDAIFCLCFRRNMASRESVCSMSPVKARRQAATLRMRFSCCRFALAEILCMPVPSQASSSFHSSVSACWRSDLKPLFAKPAGTESD